MNDTNTSTRLFVRQFQYDDWANRVVLAAVEATPTLDDRARLVAAHMLVAGRVWLARIQGRDTANENIWPKYGVADCRALLGENRRGYAAFFETCDGETLNKIVAYKDSHGVAFRTATADILTQVLLHGAYHRGQLAVAIKQAGGAGISTDYITFVRQA